MAWEMVVNNDDKKVLTKAKMEVNIEKRNMWTLLISKQLKILKFW
jgi:hypothetical protein